MIINNRDDNCNKTTIKQVTITLPKIDNDKKIKNNFQHLSKNSSGNDNNNSDITAATTTINDSHK